MADRKSEGLAPQGEQAASWVCSMWKTADTALTEDRRNYWLNTSFYEGDQWVFWSPNNEVADFPRPQGRVQAVVNRIQPNLNTNRARLTKRELVFEVQATGAEDATVQAARLAEHLLKAEHREGDWESIREVNIQNVDFGGTSAIFVEWNPNLGEPLGEDPETGEVICTGNPQLSTASICEFTLEPGTQDQRDSRWVILCKAMTPEQVKDYFGLNFAPDPDGTSGVGPLQRKLTSKRTGTTAAKLTLVYTYYERPSAENPQGRHLVVVNSKPIIDEPWPFPFEHLPLYVFRQSVMPKKWTGETYLNQARSLQVQLNAAQSLIIETMKMAGNARLAIPDNAGIQADDLTDTPGEFIFYDGNAAAPSYISPAQIPAYMREMVETLKLDIDDVMYVHAISRGQAPGDRNSGLALTVLAEKDETPLGLMARDQSRGWAWVAGMVLELWAANVTELRKTVVQVANGAPPLTKIWNGHHLRGQTKVTVPMDAVMPVSKAAQTAWVAQLAQQFPGLPIWTDHNLVAKLLQIPGAENVMNAVNPAVAKAQLEHFLISTGDVILPETFDPHDVHIAEHNAWRMSTEYIYADPEVKRTMDQHVLAHMQLAMEAHVNQGTLAATAPGMETVPQDNAPPGSMVPPSSKEQSVAGGPSNQMMGAANPNAGGKAAPENQAPPASPVAMAGGA